MCLEIQDAIYVPNINSKYILKGIKVRSCDITSIALNKHLGVLS